MAQLIQAFNAQQYDPMQSTGSLPVGRHPVIIESSEVKANKANDGGYLALNLKLIDGPQMGATGVYRLNLYHSNSQAAEIAHRQLSAICHVIGVFNVQDSQQLHNIPFIVEVGLQKGEEAAQKGYTEVKKVFDINGNEPGRAGQGAAPATPASTTQAVATQTQTQVTPTVQAVQEQQPAQTAWGSPQTPAAAEQPAAWGQPAPTAQAAQATAAPAAWQQSDSAAPAAAPWGR